MRGAPAGFNWRRVGMAALWLAAAGAGMGIANPAQAALWGYVDGGGMAHFAPSALDSRYELLMADAKAAGSISGKNTGKNMVKDVSKADDAASANTAPDPRRVPGKTDAARPMLTWLEISPDVKVLQPWLREAAHDLGVDAELLKAVIAVESGFNTHAVSPRGALGLMQITPQAGDRYATPDEARRPAAERLLDARTNIRTGARMLADLTRRLGRIDLALAAWNAGEGAVRRSGGAMPPIDETQAHVQLVLELYWGLLQHSQGQRATQFRLHNR